jgi:hypothetical protein
MPPTGYVTGYGYGYSQRPHVDQIGSLILSYGGPFNYGASCE